MGRAPPDRPELAVLADRLEDSLRQGNPPLTPLFKGLVLVLDFFEFIMNHAEKWPGPGFGRGLGWAARGGCKRHSAFRGRVGRAGSARAMAAASPEGGRRPASAVAPKLVWGCGLY